MRATLVLNSQAGRALRKAAADVRARDVLWYCGNFAPGDAVYLTFCGVDGGQFAIASARVRIGQDDLAPRLPPLDAAGGAMPGSADATLVVASADVQRFWP